MGTFQASLNWSVPRHVTLWQKMLVTLPITFPLTVLTTSEEYSGSLEAAMSENHPTYSSVKWEVLPFFCQRVSWMQPEWHSNVQVASAYGKGSLETRFFGTRFQASTVQDSWINLAYDSHPSSIGLSKTCDPVTEVASNIGSRLSIDLLTTSEEYSGSLEAAMSENHPTSSSVKWDVLLSLCVVLSWMQFAGHSRGQVPSAYGKGWIETRSQAAPLQASTGEHSWVSLAYDSHPSSIGLSQEMWHCGRRFL